MASSSDAQVKVGSKCVIAAETDFRGRITFGNGTVVHPQALIHSTGGGEIHIGSECIIEELVQIVHTGSGSMIIGDRNLFEAGCRIESPTIGSHNTFEPKCKVLNSVAIENLSTVGAGCIAQPPAQWLLEQSREGNIEDGIDATKYYTFPSRTVIFGQSSQTRLWSGNGIRQEDALHVKHLDYLRETMPRVHKLRII